MWKRLQLDCTVERAGLARGVAFHSVSIAATHTSILGHASEHSAIQPDVHLTEIRSAIWDAFEY